MPNRAKSVARRRCERRKSAHQRGYGRDWRRVRAEKLWDQPCCEDCLDEGLVTPAVEVHHLVKVRNAPHLRLEMENLRSLCKSHHSRRTARGE